MTGETDFQDDGSRHGGGADDAPLLVELHFQDGKRRSERVRTPCTIGRDAACDLRIRHWRVARSHARLTCNGAGVVLEDQGSLMGTTVNGQRVAQYAPLRPDDEVVIGPCLIRVSQLDRTPGMRASGAADAADGHAAGAPGRWNADDFAHAHRESGPGGKSATGHKPAKTSPAGTAHPADALALAGTVQASDAAGAFGVAHRAGDGDPCRPDAHPRIHAEEPFGMACRPDAALDCATAEADSEASLPDTMAPNGMPRPDTTVPGKTSWSDTTVPSKTSRPDMADMNDTSRPDTAAGPEPSRPGPGRRAGPAIRPGTSEDARQRKMLRDALLRALDLRRRDVASMSDAMLRSEAQALLARIVQELPAGQRPGAALVRIVLDEAVGLGPLEPLLEDDTVTEIMVNRYDEIYVEREGRLMAHGTGFSNEQSLLGVIEKIVSPLGRRIDESSPLVDARLPDGSRVHAVIAPVALKGAALTLRKFPQRRPGMDDLVAGRSLDARMARFLALCVARRKSIVVAGGTGSGKTTLINVLSHCVPEGERIVTIEDAAELRLQHAHLVALESRPPNLEGKGGVTIRELVRNALRMRPDRIIVGECRGAEAFDMLAAMNTGHEGSLTSLHANNPRDALARLETMILMAGMALPLQAVREHIASAVDLIVQQFRLPSGRRLVTAIVEVTGMESGRIQVQELFRHERGTDTFQPSGLVPSFFDQWREQGLDCDMGLFQAEARDRAGGPAPGGRAVA